MDNKLPKDISITVRALYDTHIQYYLERTDGQFRIVNVPRTWVTDQTCTWLESEARKLSEQGVCIKPMDTYGTMTKSEYKERFNELVEAVNKINNHLGL